MSYFVKTYHCAVLLASLCVGFLCAFSISCYGFGGNSSGLANTNNNQGGYSDANKRTKETQGVSVDEHLGTQVDWNGITVTNQQGQTVSLTSFLHQGKPIVLTLNYFHCKVLCSLQLTNLIKGLSKISLKPGVDYIPLTISFDPKDTAADAHAKWQEYSSIWGAMSSIPFAWNVMVSSQDTVLHHIASNVGFFYQYIPESKEYSHAAVIFFISPEGTIVRYLYGISFDALPLKASFQSASSNTPLSTTDKVLLLCYCFNPLSGTYDFLALRVLQIAALIVLIALGSLFAFLYKRYK
jgi:protein SCO1